MMFDEHVRVWIGHTLARGLRIADRALAQITVTEDEYGGLTYHLAYAQADHYQVAAAFSRLAAEMMTWRPNGRYVEMLSARQSDFRGGI